MHDLRQLLKLIEQLNRTVKDEKVRVVAEMPELSRTGYWDGVKLGGFPVFNVRVNREKEKLYSYMRDWKDFVKQSLMDYENWKDFEKKLVELAKKHDANAFTLAWGFDKGSGIANYFYIAFESADNYYDYLFRIVDKPSGKAEIMLEPTKFDKRKKQT